ncbi:MAG: hypothetical protein HRU70_11745 [Phycisphaeraceae bacterium]|nr:MAG: hypothetical protein HRU70_11745 [Phycisphaeraceae bacterium]
MLLTPILDREELRAAAHADFQRVFREAEPPEPRTRISHSTDAIVRDCEVWERAESGKGDDAEAVEWRARRGSKGRRRGSIISPTGWGLG